MSSFKVAAAHVAPVFLDSQKTIEKVCSLVREAATHGAKLVAFPETFVPAFPVWSCLRSPLYNHDHFCRLVAESLLVPGPELARVQDTARSCGILVSLGFNERSAAASLASAPGAGSLGSATSSSGGPVRRRFLSRSIQRFVVTLCSHVVTFASPMRQSGAMRHKRSIASCVTSSASE